MKMWPLPFTVAYYICVFSFRSKIFLSLSLFMNINRSNRSFQNNKSVSSLFEIKSVLFSSPWFKLFDRSSDNSSELFLQRWWFLDISFFSIFFQRESFETPSPNSKSNSSLKILVLHRLILYIQISNPISFDFLSITSTPSRFNLTNSPRL